MPAPLPDRPTVLVLGAGASGAAAARTLADGGAAVTVLEARDRVGGRIHSDRARSVEFGAAWVHDASTHGREVLRLVEAAGARTVRTDFTRLRAHALGGRRLPTGRLLLRGARIERALAAEAVRPGDSAADVLDRALAPLSLDAVGMEAAVLLRQSATNTLAADLADASAAAYVGPNGATPSADDRLVLGGYDRLVTSLLRGVDVRLETVATAVRQTADGVEVETSAGPFRADAAVVTLPLGVLRAGAVAFSPPLPDAKQRAIAALRMGALEKAVLTFRRPLWALASWPLRLWRPEPEVLSVQRAARDGFGIAVGLGPHTGAPIWVGMAGGAAARWVREAGPDAVAAEWRRLLDEAIPGAGALLDRVETTGWGADPFARGAYSVVPPGVGPEAHEALAAPAGRLWFAGEATAGAEHGSVHGAYRSGLRAARQILAA